MKRLHNIRPGIFAFLSPDVLSNHGAKHGGNDSLSIVLRCVTDVQIRIKCACASELYIDGRPRVTVDRLDASSQT